MGEIAPLALAEDHDCDWPGRQGLTRCRSRICLLKGCGRRFRPFHCLARYCSESCRDSARRWSVWQAGRRYRASERGKKRRRRQACRYRERVRQRQEEPSAESSPCEGHQYEGDSEKIACSRPGCYELFIPERRSPLKRFCSFLCREALRRVRRREARWKYRHDLCLDHDHKEWSKSPPGRAG